MISKTIAEALVVVGSLADRPATVAPTIVEALLTALEASADRNTVLAWTTIVVIVEKTGGTHVEVATR